MHLKLPGKNLSQYFLKAQYELDVTYCVYRDSQKLFALLVAFLAVLRVALCICVSVKS